MGLVLSLLSPSAAQAHSLALALDMQLAVLLGAGSSCVTMSYDVNGNRTAQSVVTIGSSAVTWGGAPFGCFIWSS